MRHSTAGYMSILSFFKPRPEMPPAPACRVRCEICGAQADFLGEVDFNKSCEEANGTFLPPAGRMVEYFLCDACNFCFAPEFRNWTLDEFVEKIYNEDYVKVDPEYKFDRPDGNAALMHALFGAHRQAIRHLDYGGGSGLLSSKLRENGWNSQSFDPVVDRDKAVGGLGTFNFITAFEVFEHVPDVNALADQLAKLCSDDGMIMFSTLCTDGHIGRGKDLTWWYAAPRNGHISLFSHESLKQLMTKRGLSLYAISAVHYVAFRSVPPWSGLTMPGQ